MMPGRTPRVGLITFGCRLNQYETQMMRERLEPACEVVERAADIYLINACTVTALAERKARQVVHRLRRREPQARIVVVGCLADAVTQGLSHMEGPDLFIGNAAKPHIEAVVRRLLDDSPAGPKEEVLGSLDRETVTRHLGHVRAFLKVQDGCDGGCSFCRTTQVRGRSRSKSVAIAVSEARGLIAAGHPEIVLTGINLAQYAAPDGGLPELVRALLEIPELRRLRLGSINASGLTAPLIAAFAEDPRACVHFHVPLQSGDDDVLRAMRRATTVAGYRERVETVRRHLAWATFGADIIVGFPGEDETAFERTCQLVEEIGFANLHVFRYSPRAGTQAAGLPHRVPEADKKLRARRLEEIGERVQKRVLGEWIGRPDRVLVETIHDAVASGYSRGYLPVQLRADETTEPGHETAIRFTRIVGHYLEGVKDDRQEHG